MTARWDRQGL